MSVRIRLLAIGLLLLVCFAPSGALAKLKKKTAAKIWPSAAALALDPTGVPHLAFQSIDHRPYHAALVGRKFVREIVDGSSDAGWASALGVDSGGRVHLAYHAERMLPSYAQALVYAYFDGAAWQTQELKHAGDTHVGGYATSLALDAADRAHLLYTDGSGNLEYARREDAGWEFHATGFVANWFLPTQLALDADAKAHACYTRNTGFGVEAYYATNVAGDWQELLLDASGARCALALDGAGHPSVAVLGPEAIALFRHDGVDFVEETILDLALELPGLTVGPDGIALALGAGGRPYLVVTLFVSAGDRGAEIQLFLAHDGEEWRAAPLGRKDEGFDPVLAVGPDGKLHGIWRSGGEDKAKLSYFLATFPDLAGSWSAVAVAGGVVSATLSVVNEGTDKSKSAPIALYLSSDATLDPADTLLPAKLAVGGLKPGTERLVRVEVVAPGATSGQYLIAVLDPEKKLEDLDRSDNTVAAVVP